ncbi:MAG: choline-sulfatase [Acidimicrobiia bacterium]|nr:choline-sulfatase [Acidimicrobiia bacterium]
MKTRTPNVLLVMADQLAPHATGTYGHPLVRTPNMDALARRGVRFDATYAHSPLCAPARFSFLSGQAITRIGAYDNAAEFPASVPTVAHYMRLMGYRTCLSGKMHFVGPDQLHGFDERVTTDIYPADFAWTPNWDQSSERIGKWYHNMDSLHEAGQAAMTYQIEYDEEVGFAAKRRIYDYARDGDERPWMLVASFIHPHDPYVARPEWWNLYDHDEIDLPTPVEPTALDAHSKRIRAGIEYDTVGATEEHIRSARHGYYANTSYFDSWLGRLIETVEETGQADNTLIILTADHGDMLGERGQWFKMSMFERSARVPFIIAGPGISPDIVPNACSHLDFLPTLLDIASGDGRPWPEIGQDLDGRSLWHLINGGEDAVDETTGEYCAEMTSYPIFMIRRGAFKYIHCETDPPLLYDLASDPDETRNLAEDPAHADLSAEFAAEVAAKWDSEAIREQVLSSQRARRTLHAAMTGSGVSWDYQPVRDAANEYVRNHMDWAEAGARMRFPRFEAVTDLADQS